LVNLPSELTYLCLCEKFNQQIDIPANIKCLELGNDNQYIVDNLPNGIEELKFHIKNLELSNLPSGIKKIIFYEYCVFNKELNCLPKSIEYLKLNTHYNKKIFIIPTNLKTLVCSKDYEFINDFIGKYQVIQY
jgi:hypothetical protein